MIAKTFRLSMTGLHTWAGVVIGALLFAIFWMGTLSVFDREIDRWMLPSTRLTPAQSAAAFSFDAVRRTVEPLAAGADWSMRPPQARVPAVEVRWRQGQRNERRFLHPVTGAVLTQTDSLAGSGFIFPFHFNLHLKWLDLGYWLVGLAGMAMLVLLVSGVIIHRRIFADFFLFRPHQRLQRASLDLHNLTGVLVLPFHLVMALSGLIIFMNIYWPSALPGAYGPEARPKDAFFAEAYGTWRRAKATQPASRPPASLDSMAAQARAIWQGGEPNFMRVWHPGNAASYVEFRRSYADSVTMNVDILYFDAASGRELRRFSAAPVLTAQRFIAGLHFIQFDHWTLRWLYFLAGLSGCIMIATGFVVWLEARRARHARQGLPGVTVVEALSIAAVPGLMAATLAFFIANRLLPADAAWANTGRAALEMWAFYLTWLLALAHAWWRRSRHDPSRASIAWYEQSLAVALLATVAVLLNWLTTGHHPVHTIQQALWAVLGMDVLLLVGAVLALGVARRLRRGIQSQTTLHTVSAPCSG